MLTSLVVDLMEKKPKNLALRPRPNTAGLGNVRINGKGVRKDGYDGLNMAPNFNIQFCVCRVI